METLEGYFRSRIGAFLASSGASPPMLRKLAVGDPHLVRRGRSRPRRLPRRAGIGFGRRSSPTAGLKPLADGIRSVLPFSHRSAKGSTSKRDEAPEESRVVKLIHPKAEAEPVSIGISAGVIVRRSWLAPLASAGAQQPGPSP